jgi:hypothetical protein
MRCSSESSMTAGSERWYHHPARRTRHQRHPRKQQQEKTREGLRRHGALTIVTPAQIDHRHGRPLFARQQLRRRHVASYRLGRLIERKLIAQTPRKNAQPEEHKPQPKDTQTPPTARCAVGEVSGLNGMGGFQALTDSIMPQD